ncbi:MAG: hypothetical protein ACD_71C00218G0012 [uncultured bacterium (gcode 4)]|uniref:Uncharacterized protein n=1 Tax=uncultured bacterium (gcode 4) TaxID=1234023 RepID=K1Z3U2_9BACT|nr:MAG: hypothetical protein ACD_71C00218G0012 [uncultured bacterium (gcode 4)]
MKKLSSFLSGLLVFCVLQYVLQVFYYWSDSFKSKNCGYPKFEVTQEQADSIFIPSRQMLIDRGVLQE